ncbi:hypothetical protein Bca4012_054413 [Brassica carinata]
MDQNDKEIGVSSTPADSGDLPSAEVQPAPTDVPPLHVTDSGTGTYSNNNGSNTNYEVEANREEKLMVKEAKGSSRINVEDKKNPEDVLKEMQMQKTHDLYCPNCTHNITRTAKLCEKEKEKFPYIKDKFILSFVIVISFKHPFIYLPWFYNTTPDEPDTSAVNDQDSTTKPEDEKEVLGDKEGVVSQIGGGLSTPGNKTYGSETETEIRPPVFSLRTRLGKLPGILRQHIVVVPVQNVLQTELDILKSIVYGGLIESITSFGVVSSAAASGTSTINVLALGLANLFSGLFLIILQRKVGQSTYSLYGLVTSDRFFPYEHFLGNKDNVKLHCIVVVVSFIFFGVIPPLFYGLSFKITDNGHYEATVFVAASLLCVITLSFGKAHAFKKEKLKTVAVYTGIAIGASAFSFVASQHVRDLLEKYEFHMIASEFAKK